MRHICFITGTRADYGIMKPVMKLVAESPLARLSVIATNMHLSPAFGMTVNRIEQDGFHVDFKIDSLIEGDSPSSTVISMANVLTGLSEAFPVLKPDLVVLLGDRYEALAAASAAVTFGIPVAHLHGGETSEGALDDFYRHAITKLSTLHFASTQQYAERIIRMGESQQRVFHSGAPGAQPFSPDNSAKQLFYEKTGLKSEDRFLLVTMHPATMLTDKGLAETEALIEALKMAIEWNYKILFTMPNSDPGNMAIRKKILDFAMSRPDKIKYVESLGSSLFGFAMSQCEIVMGNSSSGLIEAPSFRKPSVNIGIRQKGRTTGISVISCPATKDEIIHAMKKALDPDFKNKLNQLSLAEINPYYKESAARLIAETLINSPLPGSKPFHDQGH